jgi:membrane protein YfhO
MLPMQGGRRAEIAARMFLTVGVLAPYWRLLTLSVVSVTDDAFSSDIFNGELPGRIIFAHWLRAGKLPLWTSQMCSGYPLIGSPVDPLGLLLFTLLPPAAALDLLMILLLIIAGHGAYSLARRFGADRSGAVLAGLAFAGSGYIATQFKHLSIISTIAWLPYGLLLIDRLLTPGEKRSGLLLPALGLLFANQVLAAFPQSAYISGLVYVSFALFRVLSDRRQHGPVRAWLPRLGGIAAALALGSAAGAVVLLPLHELTGLTDRAGGLDYEWATYTNFWPPQIFSFFVPYIYGDGSDGSYIGPPPFWENYGYVGAATAVVAIYGAGRLWRKPLVAFLIAMTITAFGFILGPRTPFYYSAYVLIPGMSRFRAPTRFMVVLELGLALLAAIGLTRIGVELKERWRGGSRMPRLIQIAVCLGTALDLFIHQPRQNVLVPASEWLAPPRTAGIVLADSSAPRTFTPHHRDIHRRVHTQVARGWKYIEPYFKLRDLLEPEAGGGYWNVPSADCYVGLAPRWYVSIWSYHYFENSLIHDRAYQEFGTESLVVRPPFVTLMRTFGVTHVLGPYPAKDPKLNPERDPTLKLLAREPNVYVYRVEGAARVRVVRAARRLGTEALAIARLRDLTFDPDREIVLQEAPASVHPTVEEAGPGPPDVSPGRAAIVREGSDELVVDAFAREDGFLLLADMYYPGWHATVDGVPTPIYRANVSLRGIALPKGQHTVRFSYEPRPFFLGLWITVTVLAVLFVWLGAAIYRLPRSWSSGRDA